MITSIIRTNGNSMPPKKGADSKNKLAEFLPTVIPNPKNMSQAKCQIFGRFFFSHIYDMH